MYNRSVPVQMLQEVPLHPPVHLGPYRDRDYQSLPEEPRCELLYGDLVMTPAPSLRHQAVVLHLSRLLDDHARVHGGLALAAPVDVALFDHSVVQPDVVYVSPRRLGIAAHRFEGAPDLVVEVVSPDGARRDRLWKLKLYAEAGVREYWIVDPEACAFELLVLRGGSYEVQMPGGEPYRSPAVAGLELDAARFWASIDERLAGTRV
jgi:Uma2 family endonuclease